MFSKLFGRRQSRSTSIISSRISRFYEITAETPRIGHLQPNSKSPKQFFDEFRKLLRYKRTNFSSFMVPQRTSLQLYKFDHRLWYQPWHLIIVYTTAVLSHIFPKIVCPRCFSKLPSLLACWVHIPLVSLRVQRTCIKHSMNFAN